MVKSKSIFGNIEPTKKYDMDEANEDEKEESEADNSEAEPNADNDL